MNSRERLELVCKFQKVDRPIRWEWGFWQETINRWQREGMDEDVNSKSQLFDYFGLDQDIWAPVCSGYTKTAYWPPFEEKVLEETGEYRIFRDANNILMKRFKTKQELSMPQFLKFPVENHEDWEEIKKQLQPNDERLKDWEKVKIQHGPNREHTLGFTLCGAYGQQRNLFGVENLSMGYYDNPKLIEEIMGNWVELNKSLCSRIIPKLKPEYVLFWEDMCFKNGPLVSPAIFKQFISPYYKQLVSHIISLGLTNVWVDTDGDCSMLIPLFLEVGVTGLMPMEVQAGMDVVKVRKEYKDLVIMGGLKKSALAESKEAIKKEVMRKVPFMYEKGGYIASLDHTAPPDIPLENYRYYRELLSELE